MNGVSEGTLMTAVQPVAMTGAIFLAIIPAGKFHLFTDVSTRTAYHDNSDTYGTSKAHTPIGCLTVKFRVPGIEQGMVSPFVRSASPANQLTYPAA